MIVPDNVGILPGAEYATANDIGNSEATIVGLENGDATTVEGVTRSFHRDDVLVVASRPEADDTLSFVAADDASAAVIRGEDRTLEVVDLDDPNAEPMVIEAASADFVTR